MIVWRHGGIRIIIPYSLYQQKLEENPNLVMDSDDMSVDYESSSSSSTELLDLSRIDMDYQAARVNHSISFTQVETTEVCFCLSTIK